MAEFICEACKYAFAEGYCCNPGCEANPRVSQAQKDLWRTTREKAAAEEAERERIRRIRYRMR